MNGYEDFLASKQIGVGQCGRDVDPSEIHSLLFDWQRAITAWAIRKGRCAIFADCGLGKAQPVDERVLTPGGWTTMGSLNVGDQVIAADGTPTRVVGVYPQGRRSVYRVEFSDGASVRCDDEHLWAVRSDNQHKRDQPWKVMSTRELRSQPLRYDRSDDWGTYNWRIPLCEPVRFERRDDLPVDPYVLGVLLGDGCLTQADVTITVNDRPIIDRVAQRLQPEVHVTDVPDTGAAKYRIAATKIGYGYRNPVLDALRELSLMGAYSHQKYIPAPYFTASVVDRLELLRGLMDTDGESARGYTQFCTTSERLAAGVTELVRSLGGLTRTTTKRPTYTHNGERRRGRLAYLVQVRLAGDVNPFALPRKADRYASRSRCDPCRKIVEIEHDGYADCVCIAVDSRDSLYITAAYAVTHNTLMQLEWARLSSDNALVIAPLSVARQTVREGRKLDLDVTYVRKQSDVTRSGLWITNYEMAEGFDPDAFDAVVLDESSILKNVDGKTRQRLTKRFQDVPSRLACTATPAPNDVAELTNHAAFLGVMSRAEMLAAYFVNDEREWRLKGHAIEPMFEWLSTWAVALRRPSDLGWPDGGFELPPLGVIRQTVDVDLTPDDQLFATDLGGIGGRARVRRETLDARCERAVELIESEDRQWIAWCRLNDEASTVAGALDDAVNVQGTWDPDEKAEALEAFQDGQIRVLVTKPSIAGFGMNFQNCARMVFVGLGDSYESYYQTIRRCWRFGQEQPVHAHIVVSELEEQIVDNVRSKERESSWWTRKLIANAPKSVRS